MLGILLTILMLNVIIALHEGGHYFFMRRYGVPVAVFSIGFGTAFYSRTLKSGTVLKLCILPLGGYVMPAEGNTIIDAKTAWQRLVIYSGGMLANALTAFVLYTFIFFLVPVPEGWVEAHAWIPDRLQGVALAFRASFVQWLVMPYEIFSSLAQIFDQAVGPVGIIQMGQQSVEASPSASAAFLQSLLFVANISVALAGFNLLPFMPLDGGKIVGIGIEKALGSRSAPVLKAYTFVSMGLFLLFFLYVVGHDIFKAIF